ncbi:MAG: hypothetical protein COB15_08225 [Flavobacteriales bacterium]|nr:MAG: hypothetical protein COB15_08225 [Flavobacteriales bacterium]
MNRLSSVIIILFISTNLFGQNLNDLIITKNQDSIRCKITLVNDANIFYQYKKKKNIKTDYISRELVLDFRGDNLENITVSKKDVKRYSKCDTCTNWIVDQDNDTIFYNLVIKYIENPPSTRFNILGLGYKKDSTLIESIKWKDRTTTILYNICEIKSVSWNGINYFTFKPDFRYEHSNVKYMCEKYLGYYEVKSKVSLIRFTSVYESQDVNMTHSLSSSIKTSPEYCIEIGSDKIMIPKWNRAKHFRIAMMEVLHQDKKLVERIKNLNMKTL